MNKEDSGRSSQFETETHDKILSMETQLSELKAKVDEVYDIVSMAKGFFRVLGIIGAAIKWLTIVCTAAAAAMTIIKTGK